MNILFLDDDPERHAALDASLSGHSITHCSLFSEYSKALQSQRFDIILLDCDLDDLVTQERVPGMYGGNRAYDGTDAAELLAAQPSDMWPDLVVIHSWNGYGACDMEAILKQAGMPNVHKFAFGPSMLRWVGEVVKGMAA